MKVLIACEYSGIVRDAFTKKGHYAMSCDLLPTESPGPHYQGNVFDVINDGWDLMIAHPPCTFLSYAANRVWNTPGRAERREEAIEFVKALYNCEIPHVVIENPLGELIKWRPYDQKLNPFNFGDAQAKRICLWLKNTPPLIYTCINYPKPQFYPSGNKKHCNDIMGIGSGETRRKNRAKFFPGIAEAMANQWGG